MSTRNLSPLLKPLREIFFSPRYLVLWFSLAFIIFSLALFYPNLALISHMWAQEQLSLGAKLRFMTSLYGGLFTNFSLELRLTTFVITALTTTQLILLYRLIREQGKIITTLKKHGTLSFVGIALATLGLGCAACGALILSSLLALASGSWLLTELPWHGQEVALLAVIVLGLSNYLILRHLTTLRVCN